MAPQKCRTLTVKTKDRANGRPEQWCRSLFSSLYIRNTHFQLHTQTQSCSHMYKCAHTVYMQTHAHTRTHTGTLVKAVVADEAAVRPGLESENWRSGLMAVKAPTTESILLILLACFLIPLSFAQSHSSASVTRTTSGWLAPVKTVKCKKVADIQAFNTKCVFVQLHTCCLLL